MSVSFTQQYTNPSDGKLSTASVTVDVKSYRKDATTTSPPNFVLSVTASGKDEHVTDITTLVQNALEGKKSSIPAELAAESFTTGALISGQTVLPLFSVTGFNVGDPIVVKSKHGAADYDYAIVTAVSTALNQITVTTNGAGVGIGAAYPLGAIVQNLAQRDAPQSAGVTNSRGVKAQLEAPTAPTVTVANGVGNSADLTITPASESVFVSVDVYATRAPLVPGTFVPTHLNPVYQDAREATGIVNVTQYTEDDNQVYSLQSGKKFYFYPVSKDAKGNPKQGGVNQSKPTEKSLTLD